MPLFSKKGKGKGAYSSSWNSPQNYETPLVKWDHTVLSATRQRWPPRFTPTGQVGTRFIDPIRMKGWVGLVGWLHTEMVSAEYLRNATRNRHSFNEILIGSYTRPRTEGCHFERAWVTLSDLAKYSTTQSARSLSASAELLVHFCCASAHWRAILI